MIESAPALGSRFDPRFSVERNWEIVEEIIQEARSRGLMVTPTTVFDKEGTTILGWKLDGWKPPPGKIIYEEPVLELGYISDWVI